MKPETETVYGVSGARGYTLRFNVVNECSLPFDRIIQSCQAAQERLAQRMPDECRQGVAS